MLRMMSRCNNAQCVPYYGDAYVNVSCATMALAYKRLQCNVVRAPVLRATRHPLCLIPSSA